MSLETLSVAVSQQTLYMLCLPKTLAYWRVPMQSPRQKYWRLAPSVGHNWYLHHDCPQHVDLSLYIVPSPEPTLFASPLPLFSVALPFHPETSATYLNNKGHHFCISWTNVFVSNCDTLIIVIQWLLNNGSKRKHSKYWRYIAYKIIVWYISFQFCSTEVVQKWFVVPWAMSRCLSISSCSCFSSRCLWSARRSTPITRLLVLNILFLRSASAARRRSTALSAVSSTGKSALYMFCQSTVLYQQTSLMISATSPSPPLRSWWIFIYLFVCVLLLIT